MLDKSWIIARDDVRRKCKLPVHALDFPLTRYEMNDIFVLTLVLPPILLAILCSMLHKISHTSQIFDPYFDSRISFFPKFKYDVYEGMKNKA